MKTSIVESKGDGHISNWEITIYNGEDWVYIGKLKLESYPHTTSHALQVAEKDPFFREMFIKYCHTATRIYK